MADTPKAAGHSSLDLIDADLAFRYIVTRPDAVYLDLACGSGRYSLALADRLGGHGVIHALDLWRDGIAALVATARERGFDSIRPRVADVTRPLPLDDGVVDVCFMATVLHDLPEAARGPVLGEIRRVLAPGGAFVLIEFKSLDHGPGPSRSHRIGAADAEVLATTHGFRPDVSLGLGEFTYLSRFLAG